MLSSIFLLLLLAAIAHFWHSSLLAHERAHVCCLELCRNAGFQLLDQTVALHHLTIRRDINGRLGLRRNYRFELSTNGIDRQRGNLYLFDERLESYSLPVTNGFPNSLL